MKKYTTKEIREFTSEILFEEEKNLKQDPSYPKISIVTPSFNQGKFLERTIISVLNQNYPNLEYIIIDGGSTDGSVEIIKKYEKYLAYWISEKDSGQSEALNKGFNKATGDIIGWQNSDDIYLPGSLYKVAALFKKNPRIDIIFGNNIDIDKQDRVIGELRFTPFTIISQMYEGTAISNQSAFWKKTLFEKIGMIDSRFHISMDYEFFLRAGIRGAHFKHIPCFWGAMRRYNDTKTGNPSHIIIKKKEHDIIDKLYGKKKFFKQLVKNYSLLRRSVFYILQFDWDYILNGIKKRTHIEKHNEFKR